LNVGQHEIVANVEKRSGVPFGQGIGEAIAEGPPRMANPLP
jgi:hypothetical protein